jgi:hypothetical protein
MTEAISAESQLRFLFVSRLSRRDSKGNMTIVKATFDMDMKK